MESQRATLAVPMKGKDIKLAAKKRAAAKERSADQRRVDRPIWRQRVKVAAQTAPGTLPASGQR